MSEIRLTWRIACKDLRLEFRTPGRLLSMVAFVVLAGFLFGFALDRSVVPGREVAATLTWLIILFATTAGAGRIFDAEEEDSAFRHLLLTPVSRPAVFLGKTVANLIVVWLVTALTFQLADAFRRRRPGLRWPRTRPVSCPHHRFGGHRYLYGGCGGTARCDTLLPVLTFPLLVPVIYFGTTSTARVFLERPWTEISGSVRLLWAFAVGAIVIGGALFSQLTDE